MECPGFSIDTDATILHGGHLGCRARMNHTLRITVEERQVQCLVNYTRPPIRRAIGNERYYVVIEVVNPGASPHRCSRTAACAYHTKMSEQAEAAQDASCDDQHYQSQEQSSGATRNFPPLALPRWREEWHLSRRPRGGCGWFQGVIRCKVHGLELLRRSGKLTYSYLSLRIDGGRSAVIGRSQSHSFERCDNLLDQNGTIARANINQSSQFETAIGKVVLPALALDPHATYRSLIPLAISSASRT
jgi:hypothetical protein